MVEPHGHSPWLLLSRRRRTRETTSAEAHQESFDFAQDYPLTHSSTGTARGFLRRRVKILYSERFFKSARKLPKNKKEKLTDLLELMKENPFHPKLHSKALTGNLSGLYSFRITREWRVIFHFLSPDEINLLDVGHRKDIYR